MEKNCSIFGLKKKSCGRRNSYRREWSWKHCGLCNAIFNVCNPCTNRYEYIVTVVSMSVCLCYSTFEPECCAWDVYMYTYWISTKVHTCTYIYPKYLFRGQESFSLSSSHRPNKENPPKRGICMCVGLCWCFYDIIAHMYTSIMMHKPTFGA